MSLPKIRKTSGESRIWYVLFTLLSAYGAYKTDQIERNNPAAAQSGIEMMRAGQDLAGAAFPEIENHPIFASLSTRLTEAESRVAELQAENNALQMANMEAVRQAKEAEEAAKAASEQLEEVEGDRFMLAQEKAERDVQDRIEAAVREAVVLDRANRVETRRTPQSQPVAVPTPDMVGEQVRALTERLATRLGGGAK